MEITTFIFGFVSGALFSVTAVFFWAFRAVRPYMKAARGLRQSQEEKEVPEPPASFIFLPDSLLRQQRRRESMKPPDAWPPHPENDGGEE
jgi:hypothetical protein